MYCVYMLRPWTVRVWNPFDYAEETQKSNPGTGDFMKKVLLATWELWDG